MAEPNMKRMVMVSGILAAVATGATVIIGLATGAFSTSQELRGGGIPVDERQSLDAKGIDSLEIRAVSEDVHVVEGSGDSIDVRLHGTARVSSRDAAPRLVAENRGTVAGIGVEGRPKWTFGLDASDLVLEVSIPNDYAGKLSVETVSGDLSASSHRYATVSVVTVSGNVQLGSIAAEEIALRTTSGELSASGAAARRLNLLTVSGDVNLGGLTGEVKARTTSGDTRLAFVSLAGDLDIWATSGDVTLVLPEEAGFSLDAHSTSGDLACSFPILLANARSGGGSHDLAGRVGDVSASVVARTVSGDIDITR